MKKLVALALALSMVFVVGFPLAVFAANLEARDSGFIPAVSDKGEVFIMLLPGMTLVNVERYDDFRDIPTVVLGAQPVVSLAVDAGFNYEWSDAAGTSWQLITEGSRVGPGIKIDCSWKDAKGIPRCKYVRVK